MTAKPKLRVVPKEPAPKREPTPEQRLRRAYRRLERLQREIGATECEIRAARRDLADKRGVSFIRFETARAEFGR